MRRLVFEPLAEATRGMSKAMLTQAIGKWLGHRVTLEDLDVVVSDTTLDVTIRYRIAGTDDSRILRFQRASD